MRSMCYCLPQNLSINSNAYNPVGHAILHIAIVLSSRTTMILIFIFLAMFSLPYLFALDPYTRFTKLNLPPGPIGPESVALDRFNQGPYVGVSDGKILKYNGPNVGFQDFAYTSPTR